MEETLLIRHLPSSLLDTDKEDLLHHFGAVKVRVMSARGPLRHCAFAMFENRDTAERALHRLHQLKIEGSVLIAEFAKKSHQKNLPSFLDGGKTGKGKSKPKSVISDKDEEKKTEDISQLPSEDDVFRKWGINYPRNPWLHYCYPPPTVAILTNIANALASSPKFYIQVLHIMNKMNLPAPFGPITATPPIPMKGRVSIPKAPDIIEAEEMEISSSAESEIEDEEGHKFISEQPTVKRKTKKARKRPRLLQQVEIPVIPSLPSLKPTEVFDQTEQSLQLKKIQFNITKTVPPQPIESVVPPPQIQIAPKDLLSLVESKSKTESEQDSILGQESESGGFGKLEPIEKPKLVEEQVDTAVNYKVIPADFVSSEEIRHGIISRSEMREISVFRNYKAGEATSRLYIKNLAKQTNEQDLVNIFGRYVDWKSDIESNMFDVRLMKEGRMKGQAFISLPSDQVAKMALSETNGYLLNNKPMAVQFARSAKAKDTSETKPK